MSKTGEVAGKLGIDKATLYNWIANPVLARFFSADAKGEGGTYQRVITEEDEAVLSTIMNLRSKNRRISWEEIAEVLDGGTRITDTPQSRIATDTRTISVPQARQAAELLVVQAERDAAVARAEELSRQIEALQNRIDEMTRQRFEDAQKYRDELRAIYQENRQALMEAHREIGRLEGRLEALRQQQGD